MKRLILMLALALLFCGCAETPVVPTVISAEPIPVITAQPTATPTVSEPPENTPLAVDITPAESEFPTQTETPVAPTVEPTVEPAVELPIETPKTDTVFITVSGPDRALIVQSEVELTDDMTAFDALVALLDGTEVELKTSGKGKSVYITSIAGYSERSDGAMSGWIYKVNGTQVSKSAGSYTLTPDDRVSFFFSRDMGKDVEGYD